MAKGKGSSAKKEDKPKSNAKGKGKKGKTSGTEEQDTVSGIKDFNEVHVRHILCEKYSKKEEALERLRNGEAWDTVAWALAEHAKRDRGSLGWQKLKDLKENFQTVARELEPSTLRNPNIGEAKTDQGYHLIVVENRRWVSKGK